MSDSGGVLHLRVALTTRDYTSLVDFFCAGLGLQPAESWMHGGGQGVLLEMGGGSLEVFDEAYTRYVDDVEAGGAVSGAVRLALQVPDVVSAVERLVKHGGKLIHPPVRTPWGDLNARIESPDGLQMTLYEAS
ncbi:MAG: VOC family protein [Coriobacteriia bacterium]|nr:VOC family protein [Coriobacteriia bacterium]